MKRPLIEVKNFSFSFGPKAVLKEVSFAVEAGEYVALIGPNGAGKSTLLKCLLRILGPGRGEIWLAGNPLSRWRQRDLARFLSYVPQGEGRSAGFTVVEFVQMARYPYFTPWFTFRREDHEAVEQALALTGLADLADQPLTALSGGEHQKVLLAGAIAQQAQALLLDEPTTFLDPRHALEIHALLHRLHTELGRTILTVTHDVTAALLHSQKIIALKEGRMIFSGAAAEAGESVLENLYGVRFQRAESAAGRRSFLFPEEPI